MRLGEHEEVEVQVVPDEEPLSKGLHLLSGAEAADVRKEDAKGAACGWCGWFLDLVMLQMLQLGLLLLATLSLRRPLGIPEVLAVIEHGLLA